ncbi:MAG TPA: FmdB family transcriptional regulator, partial [Phycisphaerales bacterium]|nr:FmdB family transcriptional regulator [Phycisphaerales bacterium]
MPTYVYAVILEDGSNGEHFEVVQPMSDDALTKHPETGEPVRRVPVAPNLPLSHSD